MLEFSKNDVKLKLSIDNLVSLIEMNIFDVVVEMMLSLDAGFVEGDITIEDLLRNMNVQRNSYDD